MKHRRLKVPASINIEAIFSAELLVLNYRPIAVEKAMYWNAAGIFWAGGSNALGTPLP
jgi:hypothetical protein